MPLRRAVGANTPQGGKCCVDALGFLLYSFAFLSQPHYNDRQVSHFGVSPSPRMIAGQTKQRGGFLKLGFRLRRIISELPPSAGTLKSSKYRFIVTCEDRCTGDLLSTSVQELPNPTDGCGLFDGFTGAILVFDRRPVLKKQQNDLPLLLNSFRATAAAAARVLNGKMKRG